LIKLVLIAFVSFTFTVTAQNRGVSDLGMCHEKYDCSQMLARFEKSSVIRTGWVDKTFNPKRCKCLLPLANETKPKEIRVHILNGAGLRNRRLQRHEIHFGHTIKSLEKAILTRNKRFLTKFDRRVLVVKKELSLFKNLSKCFVSPVLESDFNYRARLILLRRVSQIIPECKTVDNPLNHSCIKGFVCEKHGVFKKLNPPYIADMDGTDIDEMDAQEFAKEHSKAEMSLGWAYCNNLNGVEGFVPPTERNIRCDSFISERLEKFIIKGK
jgi:hypothetical protein